MSREHISNLGKVPIEVKSGLDETYFLRFKKQFVEPERDELELLWRRTQQPETRLLAGVKSDNDRRRRMLHSLDRYGVVNTKSGISFAVTEPYVWFQVVSPVEETKKYFETLHKSLQKGNWLNESGKPNSDLGIYRLDDLTLRYEVKDKDQEDVKENRKFPDNYNILEIEIRGDKDKPEEKKKNQ